MSRRLRLLDQVIRLAILPLVVGCAGLSETREELALSLSIHNAYRREPSAHRASDYPKDFSLGWRQAYYNISKGADPCPPSVPPERYWRAKYQNPEGRRQVASWYAGYHCGVAAAQQDGRHLYNDIPFSVHCVRESEFECTSSQALRKKDTFQLIEEYGSNPALGSTGAVDSEYQITKTTVETLPAAAESSGNPEVVWELLEEIDSEPANNSVNPLVGEPQTPALVVEKLPAVLVPTAVSVDKPAQRSADAVHGEQQIKALIVGQLPAFSGPLEEDYGEPAEVSVGPVDGEQQRPALVVDRLPAFFNPIEEVVLEPTVQESTGPNDSEQQSPAAVAEKLPSADKR